MMVKPIKAPSSLDPYAMEITMQANITTRSVRAFRSRPVFAIRATPIEQISKNLFNGYIKTS